MALTYLPLAAGGLALLTASMSARAFSESFWTPNEILPTPAWMMPVLSTRVLHLAGLDFLDGLGDVEGHRASLGVRHETAGAQDLAQAADALHHVRGGHQGVELDEPALDAFHQIVAAHDFRTGGFRFLDLFTARDDRHPHGLARSVGQDDGSAHHLVRVPGVDAEPHVHLNRLVELGEGRVLDQGDGFLKLVGAIFDLGGGSLVLLSRFCHNVSFSSDLPR